MGSNKGSPWSNMLAVLIARWGRLLGGRGKFALLGLVTLVALGVGLYFAWQKWGPEFTSHPRFVLSADKIEITPQPPWIHTDVKAEVIRDGSLDELRILDEQVTVKVAGAFALHNWVASVKRVSKHAGPRIVVELEYRKPAAMVEVTSGGARGLLPVDAASVLLPTEDFSPAQTRLYPRVSAGETAPAGLVGTLWGDERIAGAARLAAVLDGTWSKLGLYRIVASGDRERVRRGIAPLFELQSRQGSRVVWGRAPGQEAVGELAASEKLARLEAYLEEHGPFDSANPPVTIDLREHRPSSGKPQSP